MRRCPPPQGPDRTQPNACPAPTSQLQSSLSLCLGQRNFQMSQEKNTPKNSTNLSFSYSEISLLVGF